MGGAMDHDDFSNVSWRNDPSSDPDRPAASLGPDTDVHDSEPQNVSGKQGSAAAAMPGRTSDALDTAGVGDGILQCIVNTPLKEGDGSKDAYISYLITTNVCCFSLNSESWQMLMLFTDHIPFFSETNYNCSSTIHRFCVPI